MKFLVMIAGLAVNLFFFSEVVLLQKINILQVRKDMLAAINSSKVTDSLYNVYQTIEKKPPVLTAYIGALQALKAKDSWNPYNKVRYLVQSGKTIQQAINLSPDNMEIRFIRFSIQTHLPGFLGLNSDLSVDKKVMLDQLKQKHYSMADNVFVAGLIQFLLDSKQCTPKETQFLKDQLALLK